MEVAVVFHNTVRLICYQLLRLRPPRGSPPKHPPPQQGVSQQNYLFEIPNTSRDTHPRIQVGFRPHHPRRQFTSLYFTYMFTACKL